MSVLNDYLKRLRGDTYFDTRFARAERDLQEIRAAVVRIEKQLAALSGRPVSTASAEAPAAPKTVHDEDAWAKSAQPGELAFHIRPGIRARDDQWSAEVNSKWEYAELGPNDYEGKVVVDIGAGSRLRTLYFKGAHIVAVEPLADEFQSEVEWEDLSQAAEIYPVAAEVLIESLVGKADLVVSVNALDHGYNFAEGIVNVSKYLKPGGLAYLTFDQHTKPDNMHPLVLNQQVVDGIVATTDLRIERFAEHGRYHGGPGLKALHYWLRKP